MNKKLSTVLLNWYWVNKRDLPWRNTKDPYKIWLSEIILQQTQINQGLPYYQAFVSAYPTVQDLANASEEEVLKLWQGLGYYSRARNLYQTAKIVTEDLNGQFPVNYEQLIKLKGIGDYTASAIASICSDEGTAVVDGNVYRFLSRYFGIDTAIDSTKGKIEFKELAQGLLPIKDVGDYNQAIMEFGARQCKPKNPDCMTCPLGSSCLALDKDAVHSFPVKKGKTRIRKRYFNYVVPVSESGRTRLLRRSKNDIWKNLYEFPLIESENGLEIETLLANRKLIDEISNDVEQIYLYNETEIIHKLSHQHIHTRFWIAQIPDGKTLNVEVSELQKYPVPKLIANFLDDFRF